MLEKIKDFQLSIFAVLLCVGLIFSVKIAVDALSGNSVSVTGAAYKVVKADTVSWNIDVASANKSQSVAYKTIKNQMPVVEAYLAQNGIDKKDIAVFTPSFYTSFEMNPKTGYSTNTVSAYNYKQTIKVTSADVEKIKELSVKIQELLDKGINLTSNPPEYNYSKLSELKIELLKEATLDAKDRAKSMLEANHNKVGAIKSVKMGVFQITPSDSNSVSDWGINDTSTIDKKVSAVANVVFRVK